MIDVGGENERQEQSYAMNGYDRSGRFLIKEYFAKMKGWDDAP